MPTAFANPTPSTGAVSSSASSQHPAYWPLFAHYREAGQSATRALVLLAENWEEDVQGPLPSARTARHWALVDGWDAKVEEEIAASVTPYHAYVEMQLLRNALDAIHSLTRVMNGEISDPRLANAEVRAAFGVLERAGFGPLSRSRKTSRAA